MDIMDELAALNVYKKNRFIQIENSFINNSQYSIYEKMVYMSLCTYAMDKNNCYPSQTTIAKNLSISRTMVIKAMQGLEDKNGLLIINRKTESNRKISNLYILAEVDACTGIFIPESLKEFKQYKNKIVVIKGK